MNIVKYASVAVATIALAGCDGTTTMDESDEYYHETGINVTVQYVAPIPSSEAFRANARRQFSLETQHILSEKGFEAGTMLDAPVNCVITFKFDDNLGTHTSGVCRNSVNSFQFDYNVFDAIMQFQPNAATDTGE